MGTYVTDITIKLKQKSRFFNLPYATGDTTPTFRWDLPDNISQMYYVFEMRTTEPKYLSNGMFLCAYYSSGKIKSNIPEHKISYNLASETWSGNVEVRLRIYTEKEVYATHDVTNKIYDFEQGYNQFFLWGTKKKQYYFCFDSKINTLLNSYNFNYSFQSSTDLNAVNQNIVYTLQVSDSPLFDDVEDNDSICLEKDDIIMVGNSTTINGAFQERGENKEVTLTSLKPNTMYFFRVRSYDGYDYSNWSIVNAFGNISSDVPICHIKNVDAVLSGEDREKGEVRVTVYVEDNDSAFVNAYFCYSMPTAEAEANKLGVEMNTSTNALDYDIEMNKTIKNKMIHARFKENTICIPSNKDIVLTWITSGQITGMKKDYVFLYMIAEDEYSPSTPVNYGPITIDNTKVGEGAATSAAESFNINGELQFHLRYLQLPDTILRTMHNLPKSELIYNEEQTGNSQNKDSVRETSQDWLSYWRANENNGSFALTVKNNKFYSICPDCDFYYRWVKETYTESNYDLNNNLITIQKTGWSRVANAYSEMELITEKTNRNTIQFRCSKCGKVYSMEWRYRPDLHFGVPGEVQKPNYSYYHGYNSTEEHDEQLKKDFLLERKSEFQALKEEYEGDGKEYPYKFNEIEGFDEKFQGGSGETTEKWGYVGKSPLLTTSRRPDIDAYNLVVPPNPKQSHYGVYVDGQALHMDINKDYMHDYDDKEEEGKFIPGDSAMKALSKQQPWNFMPALNKLYLGPSKKRGQAQHIFCEDSDSVVFYDSYPRYFFYRGIICVKNIQFPLNITRNKNDRYLIQINDEIYRGSVLDEDINSQFIEFVYDESEENQYMSVLKATLNKVLGRAFSFNSVYDVDSNELKISMKYYGKNDRTIKRIKLLPVTDVNGNDISCYNALGIEYFEIYQKWHDIQDTITVQHGTIESNEAKTGRYYYYTTDSSETEDYEITENEIDNELDTKTGSSNENTTTAAKKVLFNKSTNESNANWNGNVMRIRHNMNCYPFVELYDNSGRQVFFDTKFVNENLVSIDIPIKSIIVSNWTAILSYGVPYGKNQYLTDVFYSKVINFTNSNNRYVTWNNGVAKIYHNMNCYPAIMLYDGNSLQSFFGAKVLDGKNISIDFKNLSNVSGDWRIIINKAYDYTNGRDDERHKKIEFTTGNGTFVTWNENTATFTHGLDCYPIISLYDENMELAMFEIKIEDANHISINFGDKSIVTGIWTLFATKTLGFNESQQEAAYHASGEPLFTCYPDEVNANGIHFKYTEQDYYKTKKIYIRRFHYEICNPFEHPVYGYRNWIVEPIPGKEGRYRKKKVLNARGIAAEKRIIAIKNEESKIVYEFGYFNPTTNECVSHEKEEDTFTDKGEQIYTAKEDYKWQNDIMMQVCIVFDYVEYQEAFVKNPVDTFQYHPFNHKSFILPGGDIEKYRFDKKYGLYLLGEYRQRKIDTYGNQIIYDGNKIVLRYPNGEFVYSESGQQMYRTGKRIIWYDLDGREQEDTSGDFDAFSVPATELKIHDNNGVPLEYDVKGNQYLKVRARNDIEYSVNGNVYPYKLDDKYVYDNAGHRILRDSHGEFYVEDAQKVYISGFENISVPVVSENGREFAFNTESNDSKSFNCLKLDEAGEIIYETDSEGEFVLDEHGKKKRIEFEQTNIKRYEETWNNVIPGEQDSTYRFAGLVIDDEVPKMNMIYSIFKKYGYQPEKCLEPYFKKDTSNIYADKYIPNNTVYVHDIYNDAYGDLRIGNYYDKEITLIPDKTLEDVGEYLYDNYYYHEERGLFYKGELLDYRVGGKSELDVRDYFSGLPRDEHEAYSIRPDIVYREDRPWRILGEVDWLEDYGQWAFMFLQSVWNSYNRIHWNFTQGTNEYVILSAVEILSTGAEGPRFSVKTKRSVWDEIAGAWCIPYSKIEGNSDMIDTLNNPMFVNGHYYRFYIKTVNKNNGTESADEAYSLTFTTSPEAVSPATITESSYDPWTKLLTIKFRLDDALGRKYDVIGIKYSQQDPVAGTDNMDGTWTDIPLSLLSGKLIDLGSNTRGDNVPSNNYITYHTVYLDLSQVVINSSTFRIRLITEIAENRSGLTLPNFFAKMWTNEFLKPVEKTIYSLGGSWNRWIWKSEIDYETGETSGQWVYADKPVWVNGKIQDIQETLDEIDNKFDEWYATVAKFRYPDMDGFENYLHWAKDGSGKNTQYEIFYYTYFFDDYLNDMNMCEQYDAYKKTVPLSYTLAKTNMKFLEEYYQTNSYKSFYFMNREKYLALKMNEVKNTDLMQAYLSWYEQNKSESYEHARQLFMEGWRLNASGEFAIDESKALWEQYNEYWLDESSSLSSSEEEFEDEEIEDMTEDEKIVYFLKAIKQEDIFNNFYTQLYMYPDTRYEERKTLVASVYEDFEEWLESPEDEYGNALIFDYFENLPSNSTLADDKYISDQYIYFLKWAYANNVIENIDVQNSGQQTARIAFMQLRDGGISYNQKYQSLVSSQQTYTKQLETANNEKLALETNFRKNLVSQGFFTNGFVNNKPYKDNGDTNVAFRFRIESQPYEGSIADYMNEAFEDSSDSEGEENVNYGGYEERWNIYFRMQMDFLDTFNSQPGLLPLRDFIYIGEKSDDNRIKAAIRDADNSAKTTPVSKSNTDASKSDSEISNKQITAAWAIKKKDLPGEYETDTIPYAFGDSFEQLYFWRIAPYNIVRRPVFESQAGLISTPTAVEFENGFYPVGYQSYPTIGFGSESYVENNNTRFYKMEAYFNNTFVNEEIIEGTAQSKFLSYHDLSGHQFSKALYFIYLSESENRNGLWKKDVDFREKTFGVNADQSQLIFNPDMPPYSSQWINRNMLDRGEVQFVTDRPRKFEELEYESSSSSLDFEDPEEENTTGEMVFIKDNIENFNTKWIPFNAERQKPNVIRYKDHYLLFSHKHDAVRSINGNVYAENYITMSRGFSPNVFGEECIAFPRYYNFRPSNIIKNALSFENPCVCYYNSTYYMYFNVLFYDETTGFRTEIYRAETEDMDEWKNFEKVNMKRNNQNMSNIGEPNVLIIREVEYSASSSSSSGAEDDEEIIETYRPSFHLFASAKLDNDDANSIYYWTSNDGLTFNYKECVYSDLYGCYSPSAIIYNDTFKVYFSLTDATGKYGIILSIVYNKQLEAWLSGNNLLVEKSDDTNKIMQQFNGVRAWMNEGTYLNPCVLYDNHFGCQVLRMYYNTYDYPYVYDKTNDLILNETVREMTIHTEYLEKYNWVKKELREFASSNNSLVDRDTNQEVFITPISKWNKENEEWENITHYNGNVNALNPDFRLPVGDLRLQWFSKSKTKQAAMIITYPVNNYIRCMAQAKWIDFYNVGDTEALISPEALDSIDYNLENYSIDVFMIEKELIEGYNEWYNSLPQEEKRKYYNNDAGFVKFLSVSQRLGDYLWWSRKGPGVYRYLKLVKRQRYEGEE